MGYPGSDLTRFQHALVDVHGNYRSQRLNHGPPDELISDLVSARTLRPHIVRSGFFLSLYLFVSLVSIFIWVISVVVVAANTNPFTGPSEGAGGFLISVSYLLLTLQFLIFVAWIVALFLPLREPIAEYGLLIEGGAPAQSVSYWWIMNTVHGRQAPFRTQFAKAQGQPVLLLANGREHGLVLVRSVGTDLYVGWTMWRARSTVVMIGHIFRDMFQSGLSSDVRSASSRALRELIHSVTREGVQAAVVHPPVPDDVARAQIDQLPSLDAATGPIVTVPPQVHPQPTPPHGYPHQPYSGPPAQ